MPFQAGVLQGIAVEVVVDCDFVVINQAGRKMGADETSSAVVGRERWATALGAGHLHCPIAAPHSEHR